MTNISKMRAEAVRLFDAAVDAANPARAVVGALNKTLLDADGTLYLIAVGKAAVPMMRATLANVAFG